MSQERLGLFDTPPGRKQFRVAIALVGLLFAATLVIVSLVAAYLLVRRATDFERARPGS